MDSSIRKLIKNYKKKDSGGFNDFLIYCYNCLDQKKGSKRKINKYKIVRQNLINYLILNQKEITLELSK